MAEGHRIEGLVADLPVVEAARLAFAARFAAVRSYLDPPPAPPFADAEAIHQLRVAARRAGASLTAFDICLKKKTLKQAKAVLRALRRAAGDVRDQDTFLTILNGTRNLNAAAAKPGFQFLLGFALGERQSAQDRLAEVIEDNCAHALGLFPRLASEVEAPRGGSKMTLGDLAGTLESRFAAFDELVRTDPQSPEEFHRLRIAGKRLRYSMELFAPCFAELLSDHLYPQVESLQTLLGELQDGATAIARLESLQITAAALIPGEWRRARAGVGKLLASLKAKQRAGRKRYEKWQAGWSSIVAEHPLR